MKISNTNNYGYKVIGRSNGVELWDCSKKTNGACFLVLDKMRRYAKFYKKIEDASKDPKWIEAIGGKI